MDQIARQPRIEHRRGPPPEICKVYNLEPCFDLRRMTLQLDTMEASLGAAKQQLRRLMRQRLAAVSRDSALAQSKTILASLLTWQPYVDARRVSVFLSMPTGEVQTDAVVRHALGAGKAVYVPYLHRPPPDTPGAPARVMDMVRLADLSDYESLAPDRWGIPSIDPATVHGRERILGGPDLDLVLVPGVAFDVEPASGLVRRCGHGKGFYDLFFHRYAAERSAVGWPSATPLLYGLALTEQLSPGPAVPCGPLDRRLDGLIVGNGDIIASKTQDKTES